MVGSASKKPRVSFQHPSDCQHPPSLWSNLYWNIFWIFWTSRKRKDVWNISAKKKTFYLKEEKWECLYSSPKGQLVKEGRVDPGWLLACHMYSFLPQHVAEVLSQFNDQGQLLLSKRWLLSLTFCLAWDDQSDQAAGKA